jgi:hypothetical protein
MDFTIPVITDILDARNVFDMARTIDPQALVTIAVNLVGCSTPNEFAMWLGFYAQSYAVDSFALAADMLVVLAHAAEFVGADIACRATRELSAVAQLATMLCNSLT